MRNHGGGHHARRLRWGPAVAVLLLGLLGLFPQAAPAATVRVVGSQLQYDAAPGEANRVTVSRQQAVFEVRDPGIAVAASSPCVPAGSDVALCPQSGVSTLSLRLGDGDDEALIELGEFAFHRAILDGGTGSDLLTGGAGPDDLLGGPGDDRLRGGDGWDTLEGGPGADRMEGGDYRDTVDYSSRESAVTATVGANADDGEVDEGDYVGSDVEVVLGGDGADTLSGGESLVGNAGHDTLSRADELIGGDGDDRLTATDYYSSLYGGPGDDTLDGRGGIDLLEGHEGDDVLLGGAGDDSICADTIEWFFWRHGYRDCAGDGDDRLDGGPGDDYLTGAMGTDAFAGGDGRDQVSYADRVHRGVEVSLDGQANDGAPGEVENIPADVESIQGSDGDDKLVGSERADELDGYFGDDELAGGGGDDAFLAGPGHDTFAGGGGRDRLRYEIRIGSCFCNYYYFDGIRVSLDGQADDGVENEMDNVLPDVEDVYGSPGPDVLTGSLADNLLSGGDGPDRIEGGAGSDTLWGGHGDDSIGARDGGADHVDCDRHVGIDASFDDGGTADSAVLDDRDAVTGCETQDVATTHSQSSPGAATPPPPAPAPAAPQSTPPTTRSAPETPASRLTLGRLRLSRRSVAVPVRCSGPRACRAALSVHAGAATRGRPLARVRVTVPAHARRSIRLSLPRRGARVAALLRFGGRLVVTDARGTAVRRLPGLTRPRRR